MADQTVAHYNLLDRIGQGALGETWRARDTKFGRTVALKLIANDGMDAVSRAAALEAARTAATLSHPNLATLFEVGDYDGGSYLAYEFAPGGPLRQEMAGQRAHPRRVIELGLQVADALAEGHARGIVHGDIRPDTIFVTPKGAAKLLEFGLTSWTRGGEVRKRAAADPDSLGPDANPVVGYMSPEQALGGKLDARSDLFSLGIVLYEMLAGANPFLAPKPAETVVNVIAANPMPPSNVNRDVTPELDAVITRALAKQIDARHQSAASFAAELRTLGTALDVRSGEPIQATGDLLPLDEDQGAGKWWAAAVLGGLVLGAAAWWFLWR